MNINCFKKNKFEIVNNYTYMPYHKAFIYYLYTLQTLSNDIASMHVSSSNVNYL